jgi:pyruvate, water dikinase
MTREWRKAMASKYERLTVWYEEMEGNDFTFVGKKTANLGEMIKAGIPVPPGFAVTVHAMDKFTTDTGIKAQLTKLLTETDGVAKPTSDAVMRLIETTQLPSDIEDAIASNYRRLCETSGVPNCPVAVRSSVAVSMPGQMESCLNIQGEKDLVDSVRKCWSSAFNVEAIMYRMNSGTPLLFNIGVGISKMVNSRVTGIIFTINPINGDPSKICIDASYGLGEAVASGLVTPDTFFIDKIVMEPVKTIIGSKEVQCVYNDKGKNIVQVPVPKGKRSVACLTGQESLELARIGKLIEDHSGNACNIEFGIDADFLFPKNIMILQVRPESVWSKKETIARTEKKKDALDRMVGQLIAGVKLEREPPENVHRPSLAGHRGCCPLCTLRSIGR